MNLVDLKYSGILSTRLDRFTIKSRTPYRANCRCPICGDSQKSKIKARGWILEKDNSAIFFCHNCGASMGMANFLKAVDSNLYNEYVIDTALEKGYTRRDDPKHKEKPLEKLLKKQPKFTKKGSPLLSIKKISSLNFDHPVKKYVHKRAIPASKHYKLYYAPKFETWTNSLIPNKLPEKQVKPRLVLPFIDKKGNVFGYQGRAFDKESIRYITIMLDEDSPKIFGLDTVDFTKRYYVVEGPIDSLFLNNAVAMAGADGNANGLEHVENAVFIFDNEPRNKEIVSRMEKIIDKGYKLCIWPKSILDKDINDMVLSGIKPADLQLIIDQNTHEGLDAKLKLSYWRNVK
jgi:transcription elongation factor Elf1